MDYKEIYESWLANPYFDEGTKAEQMIKRLKSVSIRIWNLVPQVFVALSVPVQTV